MIVDASALVAILQEEPEGDAFAALIMETSSKSISVANWLEAAIKADRDKSGRQGALFDRVVATLGLEIAPISTAQAQAAREAYKTFGKHSGHAARLNFGDCFAYALAKTRDEPLLFKGNDFHHTDIKPALTRSPS